MSVDWLLCARCCLGCRRYSADRANGTSALPGFSAISGQNWGSQGRIKGQITEPRCVKQDGDFKFLEQWISPSDHVITVFAWNVVTPPNTLARSRHKWCFLWPPCSLPLPPVPQQDRSLGSGYNPLHLMRPWPRLVNLSHLGLRMWGKATDSKNNIYEVKIILNW